MTALESVERELVRPWPRSADTLSGLPAGLDEHYAGFLARTNGGYLHQNVLHFFGFEGPAGHDIAAWNDPQGWKRFFGLSELDFVFAENIVGNQYYFQLGTRSKRVKVLDIDHGQSYRCGDNFLQVLDVLLGDDRLASSPASRLYEAYREQVGVEVPLLSHLASKIPARLGGDDHDLGNYEPMDSTAHLSYCGQLFQQLKGIPDGTRVKDVQFDAATGTLRLIF